MVASSPPPHHGPPPRRRTTFVPRAPAARPPLPGSDEGKGFMRGGAIAGRSVRRRSPDPTTKKDGCGGGALSASRPSSHLPSRRTTSTRRTELLGSGGRSEGGCRRADGGGPRPDREEVVDSGRKQKGRSPPPLLRPVLLAHPGGNHGAAAPGVLPHPRSWRCQGHGAPSLPSSLRAGARGSRHHLLSYFFCWSLASSSTRW